jgi:hypothetical protein
MGKQLHRSNGVEAPGVKQALDKAEKYAKLASTAQTLEQRDQYDRARQGEGDLGMNESSVQPRPGPGAGDATRGMVIN